MQRYTLFLFLFMIYPYKYTLQGQILKQSDKQQKVNHEINVELYFDSGRAFLKASQQVDYLNYSHDTLYEIYFHLWANAYKDKSTPFAMQQAGMKKKDFLLPGAKKGYIKVFNTRINGMSVQVVNAETEIAKVVLLQPLLPNDSVRISMEFEVLIPPFYSRMGATEQFVAVTQWYPKPAVYDVNGWNTMPYLDQGEFYSEFGNYKVTITTPANFIVASGGELQNEEESRFLSRLSQYYEKLIDKNKVEMPQSPFAEKRVVTYVQSNVHDFAWFASSQFKLLEKKVQLKSNREVLTRFFAVTVPTKEDLDKIEKSLLFYSDAVGEYPYNVCSVVIGPLEAGGGMEYPTITICATNDFETIMHEIGHNWFYGVLGSNERLFPWMDESVNSFYENMYFSQNWAEYASESIGLVDGHSGESLRHLLTSLDKILDLHYRRMGESQAGNLNATEYNSTNYYSVVYGLNPRLFTYLQMYLGSEVFQNAMSNYFEEWKFKHPLPKDMQESFERATKQNLSWFFDDLLHDAKGTDFEIVYVKQITHNDFKVKFRNHSGLNIPLQYGFVQSQGTMISQTGFVTPFAKDTTVVIRTPYSLNSYFLIDPYNVLPENNRTNNAVKMGIMNKTLSHGSKIKFTYFSFIENPFQREQIIQPAVNYNMYSGWSLGLNFYNRTFPYRKFEYSLMPMLSLLNANVVGLGDVALNFRFFDKSFYRIRAGVEAKRFDYMPNGYANTYNKINPYITFYFKTAGKAAERFEKKLNIQFYGVFSDKSTYDIYNPILDTTFRFEYNPSTKANYLSVDYSYIDFHSVNPQSFVLRVEGGNTGVGMNSQSQYAKVDLKYSIEQVLKKKGRGMKASFRAGSLLFKTQNISGIYLNRGSGNTGTFDYLFDEMMIGRNESGNNNIWGRQLVERSGDLRINAPSYIDNAYMSLKLESSLPLLPIARVYSDFVLNPMQLNKGVYWVGGVSLVVAKDILEVYIPLVFRNNFRDYYETNNITFFQRIAFKANLDIIYFRKNLESYRRVVGY